MFYVRIHIIVVLRIHSAEVGAIFQLEEFTWMSGTDLLVVEVGRAAAAILGNPVVEVNTLGRTH
jgi:hypothetical protein